MVDAIHKPKNYLRIDELWAFVSVDEDGDEGICAFSPPGSQLMMTMVAADKNRVESLKPIAKDLAKKAKMTIRLVRFFDKEILEEFEG